MHLCVQDQENMLHIFDGRVSGNLSRKSCFFIKCGK